MKQSKKHSAIESITQTVIGLVTSFIIQIIIYPLLNIPVTFSQNLIITFVFFVASFLRGYVIRRYFNKIK
jgi:high-affinity Fe2+/Pb2+ permease